MEARARGRTGGGAARVAIGVLAAVAVAFASAAPAGAKGPTEVSIGVPGVPPVELSALDPEQSDVVHALAEDMGVWEILGDGRPLSDGAPTDNLGPALRVEWAMFDGAPSGSDEAPALVQTLYPFAAGGALVHTEPGQRSVAFESTPGGWYRAPDRLDDHLAALGISAEVVVDTPAAAEASSPAAGARPAGWRGWWRRPCSAPVSWPWRCGGPTGVHRRPRLDTITGGGLATRRREVRRRARPSGTGG